MAESDGMTPPVVWSAVSGRRLFAVLLVLLVAAGSALGDARAVARLLERYARDHWFGVSATADFEAAAQSLTDQDLGPFWESHRVR